MNLQGCYMMINVIMSNAPWYVYSNYHYMHYLFKIRTALCHYMICYVIKIRVLFRKQKLPQCCLHVVAS